MPVTKATPSWQFAVLRGAGLREAALIEAVLREAALIEAVREAVLREQRDAWPSPGAAPGRARSVMRGSWAE
ncbi:hypothetical protein [Streptomyces sp. NPDC058247]|uniref:hypothetical protein n=1 Tax=Streptomyces sp. NPDC058247 TaxID=3346401 RepID=UPI0036F06066